VSLLGKALRALGGAGGAMAGGLLGQPAAGAVAGSSLAGALSRWLGAGDYSVSSNSIVKSTMKASSSIPMVHNSDQSVVIRHREYIGQVKSSIEFSIGYSLPLNPGMEQTFPWLSAIAESFSEYAIKGLVYHYVPTSGSAISGTNNALGSVMMHTSYRATEALPTSKHELLNEYWACESVPSEAFCHPVECDPKENPFNIQYVRNGELPSSESRLMYDLGNTVIATSGQQAVGVVLGDLWVTYEVELRKPVLYTGSMGGDAYILRTTGGSRGSTGTGGVYFPADGTVTTAGELPIQVGGGSGRHITIPAGVAGVFWVTFVVGSDGGLTNANFAADSVLSNLTYAYTAGGDPENGTTQTTSTVTRNVFLTLVVAKTKKEEPATIEFCPLDFTAGSTDYTTLRIARTSL
jgi:hypothetical protein